jgi:hypothetical protein
VSNFNLLHFANIHTDASTAFLNHSQTTPFQQCLDVFKRWTYYPDDFEAVKVTLAAVIANYFGDCDPVWLMLTGPPSAGKTLLLYGIEGAREEFHCIGSISEPALLSADDDGQPIGILPTCVGAFGILLVADFGATLASVKDKEGLLSILRDVADGRARRSRNKTQLEWRGKCGMIAAAPTGIDDQRSVIARMGERYLYYRISSLTSGESQKRTQFMEHNRMTKAEALTGAIRTLLAELRPGMHSAPITKLEKSYAWDQATYVALCRSVVVRSTSWSKDVESVHSAEESDRIQQGLIALFKGLMHLRLPRTEAWYIVHRCALHSVPFLRTAVLQHIAAETWDDDRAYVRSAESIAKAVRSAPEPVKRTVGDLMLLGLLEAEPGKKGARDRWRLTGQGRELWAGLIDTPPTV